MLKRFVVLLISLVLFSSVALADMPDFTSMSFEDLNAMKQALDKEYNSRPEAEGVELGVDEYVVGRDILPGTYYLAKVYPSNGNTRTDVKFYDSLEERNSEPNPKYLDHPKRSISLILGDAPVAVTLNEGEVMCVDGPAFIKPTEFNPEDYYKYDPPAKTIVPTGTYVVGETIPAGSYIVYPGTVKGGTFYVNGNGTRLGVYLDPESASVHLKEGDEFEVAISVAMAKMPELTFE